VPAYGSPSWRVKKEKDNGAEKGVKKSGKLAPPPEGGRHLASHKENEKKVQILKRRCDRKTREMG